MPADTEQVLLADPLASAPTKRSFASKVVVPFALPDAWAEPPVVMFAVADAFLPAEGEELANVRDETFR
jgi:hypothetical protein